MGESISRRSFLVGAAGAVAAAGLAGCAPQPSGQAAAAGAESDLPEAWDKEADVVIIGSGAGGAAAAWWALKGGLSVIVLEEREEAGGSAIENAGQIAVGATSIHKERGYDATSDQFKAFLKACGTDGVPDELLDIFVYQGPEMIDWLTDIGVKWAPETIEDNCLIIQNEDGSIDTDAVSRCGLNSLGNEFHPNYIGGWDGHPQPLCLMATWDDLEDEEFVEYRKDCMSSFAMDCHHGGAAYMLPILRGVRDMGGEILLNTTATRGYKDETGQVVGVYAEQGSGGISVKANKAVVIAAGNWMTDSDLLEQYAGHVQYVEFYPLSVSDGGTAMKIGLDMGGHIVNSDSYWLSSESSFYLFSSTTGRIGTTAPAIYVNADGARFTAEDEYTPGTCGRLAYDRFVSPVEKRNRYVILRDEEYNRHMALLKWRVDSGLAGTYAVGGVDENAEYECDYTTMTHADTIPELAEALNMPFLETQIAIYNDSVEKGVDLQFNRFPENLRPFKDEDGPFHAGLVSPTWLGGYSHGGLDIDTNGQVLDSGYKPIPGLYAAGRSARSIAEGTHEPSTGLSCAQAMVLGMVIGKHLSSEA
mgnify:FL=1